MRISKVPDYFFQEAFIGCEVNLNSLILSGDIQSPNMSLLIMTFQSKTWLLKPQLQPSFMCIIMKVTDSYWIYANKHTIMKKKITY